MLPVIECAAMSAWVRWFVLGNATLGAIDVVLVVRTSAATLEAEQSHFGAAAVALLLVGLHFSY